MPVVEEAAPNWEGERHALLSQRISDIGLEIRGTLLEKLVNQLYEELAAKGLDFRPPVYLSDQWGCPDGTPLIGVPFYLADARLSKIEEDYSSTVEGAEESMRYLRHEAGHAFNYAYRLYDRPDWRKMFGPYSRPYRDRYRADPFSRDFVRHILGWYAQKHPDEDFAETFAVWLTPDSDWRTRYGDWPALKKLEYMETLMNEIVDKPMLVNSRRKLEPIQTLKKTLRAHYERKRRHYGLLHPHFYDRDLRKLFSDSPEHARNMKAARFIARVRRDVRRMVAEWTGEYQYTIDQVIEDMQRRANELNLRLREPEEQAKLDFIILLTVQTMNYLHSGRHRVAL
jgi:putative zinc-binding metallo-peptidase